ncbi:hypothetical protein ACFL40_05360, partial [candidate division KSB1 bacterium]
KGVEYFQKDNVMSAYISFYNFYREHPSQPDNLSYLAIVSFINKEFEMGLNFFNKILEYYPKSITGRINLATALIQLERFGNARSILLNLKKDIHKDSLVDELLGYSETRTKPAFDGFIDQDYFISNQRDNLIER